MRDLSRFRLDMTMMFAVHDALRRELERIARTAATTTTDPRRLLRTAAGWHAFKTYLHVHHTSEDDTLWPAMERALRERPDELALLAALEAEHAGIDPLLAAIDTALTDPDGRLGDLTDALASAVTAHLRHEEVDGLPLMDAILTAEQWSAFGQEHGRRIGPDAPGYLPWVLDGQDEATTAYVLDRMPEPIRVAYRDEWRAAYVRAERWPGLTP